MQPATYIGIDVAKARLDVAGRPSGEQWGSGTDGARLDALVGRLQTLRPELIVLEATGGRAGPTVAARAQLWPRWLLLAGRSRWCIPGRCAIAPGQSASWPRPLCSTRRCWPTLLT